MYLCTTKDKTNMETKTKSTKKVTPTPKRTIAITDSQSIVVPKKLNKYGEWLLSMEGKKGYITIVDQNAVLRR